jgi:hypothetical protein
MKDQAIKIVIEKFAPVCSGQFVRDVKSGQADTQKNNI